MTNRQKAFVYVALAAMSPVLAQLLICSKDANWGTPQQWAYTTALSLAEGLLVLKAWSSDSTAPPKLLPATELKP